MHSKAQSDISLDHQKWQKRQAHYQEFTSLIKDLETHYQVSFYQPLTLYNMLFPNARTEGAGFNLNCNTDQLEDVCQRWLDLCCEADGAGEIRDMGMWMDAANRIAISVKMDASGEMAGKLYEYQGHITCFSLSNYGRIDFRISNCLDALARFCGLPGTEFFPLPCSHHERLREEISKQVTPSYRAG